MRGISPVTVGENGVKYAEARDKNDGRVTVARGTLWNSFSLDISFISTPGIISLLRKEILCVLGGKSIRRMAKAAAAAHSITSKETSEEYTRFCFVYGCVYLQTFSSRHFFCKHLPVAILMC